MGGLRGVLCAFLCVVATTAVAAPAQAAPDKWIRWVNIPSSDPNRDERSTWVRSLDFIGPQLFAGSEGDGVFSSFSAAGPWSAFNGGLDNASKKAVRQVATAAGMVYAATSAGLFRAIPSTGPWQQVGGGVGPRKLNMGGIQAIHFTAPPSDLGIVVGTASFGIWYSSDKGANWDQASGLPAGTSVFHFARAGALVYAATTQGIYASLDQGRSWTLATDGIPPGETALRIAATPDQPNVLYVGTSSGIYKTTNGGVTWKDATGTGAGVIGDDTTRALLLGPASFGGGRLIAGTDDGAWATRDDGNTWGQMSPDTLVHPDPVDPAPDPLQFGQQIVWALGIGFGGPMGFNLMAGTQAGGVYAILLEKLLNTANPSITPSTGLTVGDELTVGNGVWTGTRPHFFTYQWRRCNSAGSSCVNIAGATSKKYTLVAADEGSTIRATVTGKNIVPPDPAVEITAQVPSGGFTVGGLPGSAPRPVFGSGPSITPNPNVSYPWGQVFTLNEGPWRTEASATQISPDSFGYRWQRCDTNGNNCADIPGADKKTYASTPADVGNEIAGYVTAREGSSTSVPWFAGKTFDLIERVPFNFILPRIVGEPYVGRVLSSSAGGWIANNPTFARRWMRCEADGLGCNPISGQVGRSYTVTGQDRGKRLRLEVTAIVQDPNQNREDDALSLATPVITDPPRPVVVVPATVVKPRIRIKKPRRLRVGAKLSVPKAFKGFRKVKYRWLRNGKKIRKATKRVYRIRRADRGKRIACRIRLTPAAGGKTVVVKTKAVKVPKRRRKRR